MSFSDAMSVPAVLSPASLARTLRKDVIGDLCECPGKCGRAPRSLRPKAEEKDPQGSSTLKIGPNRPFYPSPELRGQRTRSCKRRKARADGPGLSLPHARCVLW